MSVLDEIVATITPEELTQTVRRMGIAVLIADTIEAKGWTKREFAEKMRKHPSEIPLMLSGKKDFTIAELTEIEFALDTKLFFSKELDWTPNLVGKSTYSTIHAPLLEAAEPEVGYSPSV